MGRFSCLCISCLVAAPASALAAPPRSAPPPTPAGPRALVFCAPGYPGTMEEAQSRMDEMATAIAELSGWPKDRLSAAYFPQEKAGLTRLSEADVVFALVPLPFFLKHEEALKLTARLAVVQQGLDATQSWTLVAKKGALKQAADLEGWSIFSTAGYSADFVTKVALQGFGRLPAVKVTSGGQVLSALRKAASGNDKLAVVLDSEQARSVPTLPFAAELELVHVGPKVPVAIVATVGERLSAAEWKVEAAAFTKLPTVEHGKAALEGVRLSGFVPLDEEALAAAKKAFRGSAK